MLTPSHQPRDQIAKASSSNATRGMRKYVHAARRVVLVDQPAESVAPAHRTWLALAGDVQASRRIWRLQSERAMRTVLVVVRHVDSKDLVQVPAPDD